MRILFVYDHGFPAIWKDGLWAALSIIEQDHEIEWFNLREQPEEPDGFFDFALGWGAFESPVDRFMRNIDLPKGLCIAGNAFPPPRPGTYDVLFYETEWYAPQLFGHNAHRAFGINTEIFHPIEVPKVWDIICVGSFSLWKRYEKLHFRGGDVLVVGEVQENNLPESLSIVDNLVADGVAVHPYVEPEKLALLYNMSRICYTPADLNGGGERAVWEAMSCGLDIQVEPDNPKLKGLSYEPFMDHIHYAEALMEGINSV